MHLLQHTQNDLRVFLYNVFKRKQHIRYPELAHLIDNMARIMNIPVVTTNYDMFFEEITGRIPFHLFRNEHETWQWLKTAIHDSILHIHGTWAKGIVLRRTQYRPVQQTVKDFFKQVQQHADQKQVAIIFIGAYGTLIDPSFGQDLGENVRRYVLCHEREYANLNGNEQTNTTLICYGDKSHLTNFVRKLLSDL